MFKNFLSILLLASTLFASDLSEAKWLFKANGEIGSQWRFYQRDKVDSNQDQHYDLLSNFRFKAKNQKWWVKAELEARNVAGDPESSQFYAKEAWVGWLDRNFQIKLGLSYFTWSTLEVFHPIEIINSLELIDQTKIGEPMLMLEIPMKRKRVHFYLMPRLTDNIYPSSKSRAFGIDLAKPLYVKENNKLYDSDRYLGAALQWKHSLSGFDYSLIGYRGPDKNLQLIAFDGSEFRNLYFITTMLGLNLQATLWDTSLKMELLRKTYQHEYGIYKPVNHSLLAIGWEYPYAFLSGSEIFALIEVQKALGVEEDVSSQYYIFQNDLFLGLRYQWNDIKGRELTVGVVRDLSREKESLYKLEYAQRINSRWKWEAGLQGVVAPQKAATPVGLEAMDGQNYLYTKWNYYF